MSGYASPITGPRRELVGDEIDPQTMSTIGFEPETTTSSYKWDLGIGWYEEVRDSGTNFFFEWLPAGEYTFKYRLRANLAGTFRVGPAQVQSMYAPEFVAYSAGAEVEIESAGQ